MVRALLPAGAALAGTLSHLSLLHVIVIARAIVHYDVSSSLLADAKLSAVLVKGLRDFATLRKEANLAG